MATFPMTKMMMYILSTHSCNLKAFCEYDSLPWLLTTDDIADDAGGNKASGSYQPPSMQGNPDTTYVYEHMQKIHVAIQQVAMLTQQNFYDQFSHYVDVFQNMNAQLVVQAEREKKEKEKLAHEVKVDRDRRNREAQKQKVLDRKEKEKKRTQKHERRR